MIDREKVIKDLDELYRLIYQSNVDGEILGSLIDALALLKEQETEWEHLWDAPDGTYKGRCKKCGFVHYFIESHDAQYYFCPSCGRSVKWE